MELPNFIRETINSTSSVDAELNKLLQAKDDAEMLMIAHRIRSKIEVRNEVAFDLEQALIRESNGK